MICAQKMERWKTESSEMKKELMEIPRTLDEWLLLSEAKDGAISNYQLSIPINGHV
jgi:hypothetical protein